MSSNRTAPIGSRPVPGRAGGRAVGATVVAVVAVVGIALLPGAPVAAQLGEPVDPVDPTTTVTTAEVQAPTSGAPTTAEATSPPPPADDEDAPEATTTEDGGGGTSVVALVAAGVVGLLVGLGLAGLGLLATRSRRAPSAAPPPPAPPVPVAPVPAAGPAIGAPPDRDADRARGERATLVEALVALRDRLPSEALGADVDAALTAAGVSVVRPEGQRFDPSAHRAVHQVATDDPARHGTVVSVEKVGYTDGPTAVRLPEVVVAVHEGSR